MTAIQRINRALWQACLDATEPRTHSRLRYGLPARRGELGKPTRRIEPSQSREDALLEAHRIAAANPLCTGFAYLHMGDWYACDERPEIADAVICVETLRGRTTVTDEGARGWR